jgi:spermidine synthase
VKTIAKLRASRTFRLFGGAESDEEHLTPSGPVVLHLSARIPEARLLFLLLLFFISGFSALVYQTAWQRMLGLFSGSDSISATIVVGAFLLGLGLGSLLASSFADRLTDRGAVLGFALCEMGIAGFAIASKVIFYDFLFSQMVAIAHSRALVFLVAFLALLIPTLLMGVSLPLLAKGTVRNIETASERISWLYGLNTLGAAAGAFAAGCFIIGAVGYDVTVKLAAVLNLSVGAGALFLVMGFRAEGWKSSLRQTTTPEATTRMRARVWQWCFLVLVSGFIIISLEILWFRVIGSLLQTNAYSFALILGWFLFGDAVGIFVGAIAIKYIARPRQLFFWLQGAVTLYALGALWLIAIAHRWPVVYGLFIGADDVFTRSSPGHIAIILGVIAFMVMPPATLLGMSFPITQKAIQNDPAVIGQRVGLIQFANIIGNTVGSIVTGLILLQYLGTSGSLRLLALLGLMFICALVAEGLRTGTGWRRQLGHAVLAVVLLIAFVGFPNNVDFWSRLHGAERGSQVILGEDRTGISLMKYESPEKGYLFIAGHEQSKVPFYGIHGLLGFLGVLVHPSPKSVLVVGLGTGGTVYGAGANPAIDRVRVVEIVAPIYEIMQKFSALGGKTAVDRLLIDPRIKRSVGDARHVLFTEADRYDVIEADAVYPRTSLSGLLYSVEYFRQVRARLNPGGICVQWYPSERTLNSFLSAFPFVVEVNGILLGSERPVHFDAEAVASHLHEPKLHAYLEEAGWNANAIGDELLSSRVTVYGPDYPRRNDINTDLFPKDEFFLSGYN